MATLGERLVDWLAAYAIDTVFGIPGVHTIEMYRGLASGRLRHVTPRHEQGAGFMADGHARATGRPAAAFVITGPGLTNIATAMAQAYADSQPMLVVSAVTRRRVLGLEAGDLHEVKRQGLIGAQCAAFSHTLSHADQLPEVLARAFAVFEGARPRPVHLEIPVDLFAAPAPGAPVVRPAPLTRPCPPAEAVAQAATVLAQARAPLILSGGGAIGADLAGLATRLGAPVAMTTNARGVLPPDHPLAVPCSPSLAAVRALMAEADAVLAVGTEIGHTDYDMYERGAPALTGRLLRIEIDPEQMRRGLVPDLPLLGDAGAAVAALLDRLGPGEDAPSGTAGGAARAETARMAARAELEPWDRSMVGMLEGLRDAAPEAIIVGDSTGPVYSGNLDYAAPGPRQWFNAATGYGALGFGLPAAIGAAIGSRRPVICLAGDGGLQFSLAEIGTMVEERLPVILLVWNNAGYGEIKHWMLEAGVTPVGVDLHTPDFVALGRAYGVASDRVESPEALGPAVAAAISRGGPALIEVPEPLYFAAR